MPNFVLSPNIDDGAVQFSEVNYKPVVSDEMVRSLSYLLGRDPTTGKTTFITTDADGNLILSASDGGSDTVNTNLITVLTSVTLIKAANSSRQKIIISNISSNVVYIGSDIVTVGTGYALQPGEKLELDSFIGAIYGINAGGSNNVCYLELS